MIAPDEARAITAARTLAFVKRILNAPIARHSPRLNRVGEKFVNRRGLPEVLHVAARHGRLGSIAPELAEFAHRRLNVAEFVRAAGLDQSFFAIPTPSQAES